MSSIASSHASQHGSEGVLDPADVANDALAESSPFIGHRDGVESPAKASGAELWQVQRRQALDTLPLAGVEALEAPTSGSSQVRLDLEEHEPITVPPDEINLPSSTPEVGIEQLDPTTPEESPGTAFAPRTGGTLTVYW